MKLKYLGRLRVTNALLLVAASLMISCGGGSSGGGACNVSKIAGGDECDDGDPAVAYVLAGDAAGNPTSSCTGAYISLTSVLTAAHCFPQGTYQVLLASRGYERHATQLFVHPLYDGSIDSPFDIAILKVNQPINSAPLSLLVSKNPDVGEITVAYGYGLDESGKAGLQRILDGEAPLKATFSTFAGYSNATSTIVSSGSGSTCPGDSGGPVLAKNDNGVYGIIGITRAGPLGCQAEKGRPSFLSSTESVGAQEFIAAHVPDASLN